VSRFLVVATAGAGGDLPPLVAAGLRLAEEGHEVTWLGDRSVQALLARVSVEVEPLPAELDLGPTMARAVREATEAAGGDLTVAGPLVEERLARWAGELAVPVGRSCLGHRPDVAVTSLFGVEVLREVGPDVPWAVVNSTFALTPARPLDGDVAPRALPVMRRYASMLDEAALVLHASDPVFDRQAEPLPPHHRHVGPLGVWEPPGVVPPYLDEPGDPWVLVSLSSQLQDDVPLARAALEALAERPVRVLLTVGPDHDPDEVGALPPNARVESVVPHSAVLSQSRLLVSHAGHGTVMKSLLEGCPMVLVPWGRDQPGVAARAEALGVAVTVRRDTADRETVAEAVDRVLEDESMEQHAAEHAVRLLGTDPAEVAAELLSGLT
jgi:UDP:flavonoid glycosyltransferase YjiC (YdhE family)